MPGLALSQGPYWPGRTARNASVLSLRTSPPHTYWFPATLEPVMALLDALKEQHRQVILFGEVYGSRIQKLDYGQKRGLGLRCLRSICGREVSGLRYLHGPMRHVWRHDCARTRSWPLLPGLRQNLSSGQTALPGTHIREGRW